MSEYRKMTGEYERKAGLADQTGQALDINHDLESVYQRKRNTMMMGNRELAEVKERERQESDLKIGLYKKQHRFEKMQSFLSKC